MVNVAGSTVICSTRVANHFSIRSFLSTVPNSEKPSQSASSSPFEDDILPAVIFEMWWSNGETKSMTSALLSNSTCRS